MKFAYSLEKDIENFQKSLKSVNKRAPTRFQLAFSEVHGADFSEEKIRNFVAAHVRTIDMKAVLARLESDWDSISVAFTERAERIFGQKLPLEPVAYLTANQRCTYDIAGGYFFLYLESKNPNAIIMHELLHFYSWHALREKLRERGVDDARYNDIKESLTELLNIEFADLMAGKTDDGYPQHTEMRAKINAAWKERKDIHFAIERLLE